MAKRNAAASLGSGGARSPLMTTGGLICTASPLAGAIGARVLREGGNAFDATVAVAAAEAVTIPMMCGLGGEVFALLYEAKSGKVHGVTGSGRAPMAATRERFVADGHETMPSLGPVAASVPGEVDAWDAIVNRFGTRRLGALITPAAEIAEQGFPLPPRTAAYFTHWREKIARFPTTAAIHANRGAPWQAGDVLVQRDLGRSIRRIAEGGRHEFYQGDLAREIVDAARRDGGLLSLDDMTAHTTEIYEPPLTTTYRGYFVAANRLPSQSYLILELLNIIEGFDMAALGANSADAVHATAEAAKLAFADRLAYVGDPTRGAVPIDALLSKGFAAERRPRIDPRRAAERVEAGALALSSGHSSTSGFCVVDREGNAVSFIHSLSMYFGCGWVAGETGILLNDRVARSFFLDPAHPNALAPGKRPINTIQNWMVLDQGKPMLLGCTPGGDRQPQWNVQVISNLLDHGMNVQDAVERPRWNVYPGSDAAAVGKPFELRLEDGFSSAARDELAARGHRLTRLPAGESGGAMQVIEIDQTTGVRHGGTDPRCDGYPVPA
ncbi:MAG: gamma-glutamyltransferase [SAR202 cluster bacterium]|nr:gamma-glutamyltransferase [SAR202 cluster bacterium]